MALWHTIVHIQRNHFKNQQINHYVTFPDLKKFNEPAQESAVAYLCFIFT